jgi:hypothetical protein
MVWEEEVRAPAPVGRHQRPKLRPYERYARSTIFLRHARAQVMAYI